MGSPQGFAPKKTVTENQVRNVKAMLIELHRRDARKRFPAAYASLERVSSSDALTYQEAYVIRDGRRLKQQHDAMQRATGAKP